jgi:hypothetical protein
MYTALPPKQRTIIMVHVHNAAGQALRYCNSTCAVQFAIHISNSPYSPEAKYSTHVMAHVQNKTRPDSYFFNANSMTVSEVVGGIVKVYDVEKDPEKCANFSYNNSFCCINNK